MRRLTLCLTAAAVGAATGLLAWLVSGGRTATAERLLPVASRVESLRVASRPRSGSGSIDTSMLAAAPIFPMTVGPGAVREPAIRVDGLALTPNRRAALLAIDGGAATWMLPGEMRSGVTLQAVLRNGVMVDTILGSRELAIGQTVGGATAGATPAESGAAVQSADRVTPTIIDQPPTGVRGPSPPASAPR